MRRAALVIGLCGFLAACGGASANAPTATIAAAKPTIQLDALRAGIDLEQAFSTAVTAERAAKASGFLKGAAAAKADSEVQQAYTILKQVRPLIDVGAHPDLSTLTALIGDILSISQKGY